VVGHFATPRSTYKRAFSSVYYYIIRGCQAPPKIMEIAAGIKGAKRRWWHDEDEWWDSGKERETHIPRPLLHR